MGKFCRLFKCRSFTGQGRLTELPHINELTGRYRQCSQPQPGIFLNCRTARESIPCSYLFRFNLYLCSIKIYFEIDALSFSVINCYDIIIVSVGFAHDIGKFMPFCRDVCLSDCP